MPSERLENVLKMSWRRCYKTSWRRLGKTSGRRLEDIWPRRIYWSWARRLEDILKTSSEDVWVRRLYSSWSRRLEDVLKTLSEDKDKRRLQDVFIKKNVCWESTHQFLKRFFHISKCLTWNEEKKLQLKVTKKRMNRASFTNINTNIYTYLICDENDSK